MCAHECELSYRGRDGTCTIALYEIATKKKKKVKTGVYTLWSIVLGAQNRLRHKTMGEASCDICH